MYAETLKTRLQHIRKEVGLSQTDVSKELGIDRSTLANYERGERTPDVEMLGKIAVFYDVSVDWLLGIGRSKPVDTEEIKKRDKLLKNLEKDAKKEAKIAR